MFGMFSMFASTPWLQFNPLSLMNANKGVFGVNLGHMWDETDRMTGWVDQLMNLWEQDAIKPKVARISLRRSRGCPSFHSGPQEQEEGAAPLTSMGRAEVLGSTDCHESDQKLR
jgi:hypothetical protein